MNQLEKYWKILKEKGENNLKKVLYIIFISLTSCGSRMTDAHYPYTLEDTFLGWIGLLGSWITYKIYEYFNKD